jgi:hypothetical protein
VKRVSSVILAAAWLAAAGCAGLNFSPSSVERWSGAPFPVERAASIDVLPVADVRTVERGASVRTAQLVREATISLLREKGYDATASGDALATLGTSASSEAVLDPASVADRSPRASGFVLALALEQTEPDLIVAPSTVRVRLRGVIVDAADRVVVWAGASVGEAGATTGAIAFSPDSTLYVAIVQAVRALLMDLPTRRGGG